MLSMAVNGRRLLPGVPADYIGNVVFASMTYLTLSSLISFPPIISETARSIRKAISRIDEAYARKAITAIKSVPDVSKISQAHVWWAPHSLNITRCVKFFL